MVLNCLAVDSSMPIQPAKRTTFGSETTGSGVAVTTFSTSFCVSTTCVWTTVFSTTWVTIFSFFYYLWRGGNAAAYQGTEHHDQYDNGPYHGSRLHLCPP